MIKVFNSILRIVKTMIIGFLVIAFPVTITYQVIYWYDEQTFVIGLAILLSLMVLFVIGKLTEILFLRKRSKL